MRYHIETRVEEPARKSLKDFSLNPEMYNPHITFVRPFTLLSGESVVKQVIIDCCKGKSPVPYTIEGNNSFGETNYVPVISRQLQQFDYKLEEELKPHVNFVSKLDDQKILHVAISITGEVQSFPSTPLVMNKLTIIRNKQPWFYWDFEKQDVFTSKNI